MSFYQRAGTDLGIDILIGSVIGMNPIKIIGNPISLYLTEESLDDYQWNFLCGSNNLKIALKDCDGRFVLANQHRNNDVTSWNDVAKEWEIFELIDNEDGTVSFKNINGKYLTVNSANNDLLYADRLIIDSWEKFTIEPKGDKIALKAHNGKYVSVDCHDPDRHLKAEWAEEAKEWETFEMCVLKMPEHFMESAGSLVLGRDNQKIISGLCSKTRQSWEAIKEGNFDIPMKNLGKTIVNSPDTTIQIVGNTLAHAGDKILNPDKTSDEVGDLYEKGKDAFGNTINKVTNKFNSWVGNN